jgi:FKBP-type peptidyl-prolyl cis-trans isomerase 2
MQEHMTSKAKFGDVVKVNFTCAFDDGAVLDSSMGKAPLQLTIGKSGFLEAFEKAIIGMEPGEKKSLRITAEEAYGPYKDELRQVLKREQFPGDILPEPGMKFKFRQENDEKEIRVVEVNETGVTLDANPPLAGKNLLFDIELVDIVKEGPTARTYLMLGTTLQEKGLLEEATQHYLDAIKTDPDFLEAYFRLGVSYQQQGLLDEAISNYRKVLNLDADHLEALLNIGNALRTKARIDEAISYYNRALMLKPDYAGVYNSLGAAYQDKGDFDNAITSYRKALELDADFFEACNNIGNILMLKGQLKEALQYFQRAIRINPNLSSARYNISLIMLSLGNFKEGWEKYEWRLQTRNFDSHYHKFPHPSWNGSSLHKKTLLVCAEQGIRDEIMFASCLPDVISQSGLCIIECDRMLIPLFSRSFPKALFFDRDGTNIVYPPELSSASFKIAIGSLPKFFRPDLNSFPGKASYLTPDPQHVEMWQDRFNRLGSGLKVGISWRGDHPSYLPLDQWTLLLSVPGISLINLQYGDVTAELNAAQERSGKTIHRWEDGDLLKDLDGCASQIAALDLIISVDNEIVHLAGALGKPAWTLLPHFPDWRWMLERPDSPWYPTMKLFRQPSQGDWISLMNLATGELKRIADKGNP